MGLGKTVEVIGLMLMNPRRSGTKRTIFEVEGAQGKQAEGKRTLNIKCVCHKGNDKKKMDLVACTTCEFEQHVQCVFQREITEEDRATYMCPFCWKSTGCVQEASTTIIIMPASLKSQWRDEINRHVSYTNFKTLMYEGVSHGWVSPSELVKYDAVITDFNTLNKELYFSDRPNESRSLRHGKKYDYPPSPLTSVKWWRVVLDEAQMVENKQNRPSLMVAQLPAVHRWGTTGTPIEKDSLRCLYGLIYFLNFEPYTNENLFNQLFYEYRQGKPNGMIKVLSRVMWRTCKKNVEHEIQIPKQTEVMHEITMTDLQKVYYQQVHNQTKPEFLKNLQDYLTHIQSFEREVDGKVVKVFESVVDISMKERFLYHLNNATLKSFLEPLRKLRQDCTIPSIFQPKNHSKIKQTLRPEQLHEHLMTKASLETKSALRSICSSINGMAGLKMAEGKFDEAQSLYQQLLKLAKDYTSSFVTVDSMLQIHALNSLVTIAVLANDDKELEKKDEYTAQMEKMEWKYISSFNDKVQEFNNELKKLFPKVKKATTELTDMEGNWWRYIIIGSKSREEENRLLEMVELEVSTFFLDFDRTRMLQQLSNQHGVVSKITGWFDKIRLYQKEIQKHFKDFDFIINNLRPSSEMSGNDKKKLTKIAKDALDCHLHLKLDDDEDQNEELIPKPSRSKGFCDLCKLKSKLNEFECVLFNKTLKRNDDDVVEGTWNPRFEEKLLKTVLTYAERARYDDETLEMGKTFFNWLEQLKAQFKIYAKLWVEVNYTVGAFDEINMCKLRMQIVDSPEEITEEDLIFKLKIPRYDVENQLQTFSAQKLEAEVIFVRLNGRLKYLNHLKGQVEPQACPICANVPKEKYYVTACGHLMCAECFTFMVKSRYQSSVKCPVCRTIQETANIYAVTCVAHSNDPINGSFSPKIDEIVRCVLGLKRNEPDVKVLIFSHWDQLLEAIIKGLEANNIKYRSSLSSNFTKQITEFKDFTSDVTCMMMNLKFGGKGLNIIEATHVFLVEPILNSDEELQAIGRVHRIGQTRETFVHRFITKNTIEETIYKKIICKKKDKLTIRDLEELIDVGGDVLIGEGDTDDEMED